ncbi:MAG: hypothetical protein QM778_36025 [Myxococcales bacterium]
MRNSRLARLVPMTAFGLSLLSGCDKPVQDDFKSEGGISPDPTGIIEGSVLYIGPRPACEYKGDRAESVIGRVILTMFIYDNPPPPEGRATTAENLLAISGDKIFSLQDCAPQGAGPDFAHPIMRSVPFRWPQIELKHDARDFQIRGFYDYDADMNPFFSVTNLPTAGDIAGAAVVNLKDTVPSFLRISMPSLDKARDGYIKTGVTVALANPVWTERPLFKLVDTDRQMGAETPLPLEVDYSILAPKTPETLINTWKLTCGTKDAPGCGFSLLSLDAAADGPKLAASGVNVDFSPQRYAFNVTPVDIKTVVDGGPDLNKPDGVVDPHPLLGATLPVPFELPFVILQRRPETPEQGKIETAAKIPPVTMLGATLPSETGTKKVFAGKMNIAIPPIAVVELDPTNPACRVPYAPAGNSTATYEARVSYCHDLPTGVFGVNVLHGIAGGQPQAADPSVSDNGLTIVGGGSSGQAWTLPNQLADETQVGEENVLAHQGTDALFVVHDPNPGVQNDCKQALDPVLLQTRDVKYKQVCQPGQASGNESAGLYGTLKGIDGSECLQQACCDNVKHLCNLPLCEVYQERGLNVRKSPTSLTTRKVDGHEVQVPNCVPFDIPQLCCEDVIVE